MKKIILLIMMVMMITNISALIELGAIKQGESITLYQSCPTCTYSDIRAIKYPNGTVDNSMDWNMTKNNSDFTYDFNNTLSLGEYVYYVYGNKGGLSYESSEEGTFEVTPSGQSGSSNIAFHIFVIIMIYGVTFIAFFYGRNIPITILGGMFMIFLGVYMINQGIIIYRDNLTVYFSYVTIALGFIMAAWAGLEQMDVI